MTRVHEWLRRLRQVSGSDLHLAAGQTPFARIAGEITPLAGEAPVDDAALREILHQVAGDEHWARFVQERDLDFAFSVEGVARFRGSYLEHRDGVGAVFHIVPDRIVPIEQLGVPDAVHRLADLEDGLVLVTGPTGSGKSTTLAAIIDRINRTHSRHIVTLEDPVEFVHENKRSIVSQREVAGTQNLTAALRGALRQDADVVLVGNLTDSETIELAIEAAATGVLVLGAFHTHGAERTVERFVGSFPADRRERTRAALAESLSAVVSQILVRRTHGGRVAAHEILLRTQALSGAIREGKTAAIDAMIEAGRALGMQTLDQSLLELVEQGAIDGHEAFLAAADKQAFRHWADA